MSAFRDDRDALRHKVRELEQELADKSDQPDADEVKRRLDALAAQVAAAVAGVSEDAAALAEVGRSIDALRAEVVGKPEPAPTEEPAPAPTAAPEARPPRGALVYLVLGITAAVAALVAAGSASTPSDVPPAPRAAEEVPGAPHAVDPLALLAVVEKKVKPSFRLVSIEVRYVSPDGRVDLDAPTYKGSVEYVFTDAPEPPPRDPSAPVGAPAPPAPLPTLVTFRVDAAGIHEPDRLIGIGGRGVPRPRCSVQQIWQAAIAAGAPQGVAIVKYSANLWEKPAAVWELRLEGTSTAMTFSDETCQRWSFGVH